MKDATVIEGFPVYTAFIIEKKGFYRGLLQAVQQVMMLALKRRGGSFPYQGLACLLGGLGTQKVKTKNSVVEQAQTLDRKKSLRQQLAR